MLTNKRVASESVAEKGFQHYQSRQYEQGEFNLFRAERELIVKALRRTQHYIGAAKLVGITSRTMQRKFIDHNIQPEEWLNSEIPPPRKKRKDAGLKKGKYRKRRTACE